LIRWAVVLRCARDVAVGSKAAFSARLTNVRSTSTSGAGAVKSLFDHLVGEQRSGNSKNGQ
jgi:hypothetical protein